MAKVFVSYSRKNIEFAKRLTAELQKDKLDFWIDWEGIPPTVDWWKEIEKGIEEADVFLFLISPDSAKSKVCGQEIDTAVKNGKRIIPIVVHDIAWEDTPPHLGHLNYIFLRETDDFEAAVKKLMTAIQTDYEWVATHRRLQVKALEWERNSKENSFLLRGKDLHDAELQLATNSSKEPHPTDLQREYVFESRKATDKQRRITTSISIAGIAVLGVLTIVAIVMAVQATRQAKIARAGELAANSIGLRDKNFQLSLLLAIESYREFPTVQAKGALFANAQTDPQLQRFLSGNTDTVNTISFSPDGKTLVSGNANGDIMLWNLSTDPPEVSQLPNQTYPILSVTFSPDGKSLGISGGAGTFIWDIRLGSTSKVYDINPGYVAFSPDAKTLAVSGSSEDFVSIDVSNGRLFSYQPDTEHRFGNTSIAYSPDGKTIAYRDIEGSLVLWDVLKRAPRAELPIQPAEQIDSFAFSPDGKILASGNSDGKISLWSISNQVALSPLATLSGHKDTVKSITFSPDGKTMASGSADKTIILWDLSTKKPIGQPLTGHTKTVNSVAFSPNGKILASGSDDGNIILWDVEIHQPISRSLIGLSEPVSSITFSVDSRTLATTGGTDIIEYWDTSTGLRLVNLPKQEEFSTNSVAANPDWKTIPPDNILFLSDLYAISSAFSTDGKELALGTCGRNDAQGECTEGMIILMDVLKRARLDPPISGHTTLITSLAFSRDSKILASGDALGNIILWDMENRQPIGLPLNDEAGWINNIVFSPDGNILASIDSDHAVILSDLNPESWIELSCQRAGRNFTQNEWIQYFPQQPYPTKKEDATCPKWRLESEVTVNPIVR